MRKVLRSSSLRQDDCGRYLHLHIEHDVAVSILNGGALVAASCEVAPLDAIAINREDANPEATVAAINEAVCAIDAHRSSLRLHAIFRRQLFANSVISLACLRISMCSAADVA